MLDQHAVALVPYPDCNSTPPNEELVESLGGHAHGTLPILLSPLALHCFPLLPSLSLHIPRSVFLWAVLVSPDHASFLTLAFLLCSSLLPLGGISLLFYHRAPLTAQTHPRGHLGSQRPTAPLEQTLKRKAGRTLLRLQFAICCCEEGLKFGL